jgi:hypothetical protein
MNGTYRIYALLEILFSLLPIGHEALDLLLKPTAISELLGSLIYKVEFRIYPIPVLSDSVHLFHQSLKVLGRRFKMFQLLFI